MRSRIGAVLGVMCLATISQASADVDLTGRWEMTLAGGPTQCLDITQSGTTVTGAPCAGTSVYGSGTINPTTGEFNLAHGDDETFCPPPPPPPSPPPPCVTCGHAELVATAAADSLSFSGTYFLSVLRFPGICSGGIDFGAAGSRVVCGDGTVQISEQCDDGNMTAGDCCSPTCEYEPAGSPCAGTATLCTTSACDGAGTCVNSPPPDCRSTGTASLLISSPSGEANDKWLWRWRYVPLTTQADFGNPTVTTDYSLCLHTGPSQALVAEATIPADAAKWQAIGSTGYRYRDHAGAADGMTKAVLKGGDGTAKAFVKGKGLNLPDPALGDLPLPLTARLVGSGGAVCIEAVYDGGDVTKNESNKLKAIAR